MITWHKMGGINHPITAMSEYSQAKYIDCPNIGGHRVIFNNPVEFEWAVLEEVDNENLPSI